MNLAQVIDEEKTIEDYRELIAEASGSPTSENIRKLALWVYYIAPKLPSEIESGIWESLYAALPIQAVIEINELISNDFQPSVTRG